MNVTVTTLILLGFAFTVLGVSCSPDAPNELDKLGTIEITIADQPFRLWLADEPGEHERGLMFVTAEQMAPLPDGTERGMIFVFDHERHRSFWMKNTIIPLDIAYLDSNGTILSIHTMAPLDTRFGQYPSGAPARFAIEVNANLFERLGVEPGQVIPLPETLLNRPE